jgi:hypothetical protein
MKARLSGERAAGGGHGEGEEERWEGRGQPWGGLGDGGGGGGNPRRVATHVASITVLCQWGECVWKPPLWSQSFILT